VAVKEGWTTNRLPDTRQWATTPQQARTLWRSRFYYYNIGLDHFIDRRPQPTGDNAPSFLDGDAAAHQAVFERYANSIEVGLAQKIDAEIFVMSNPNGGFDVRPTSHFYELTLRLTDAYFRENVDQVEGQDHGLGYTRWNMGGARYRGFDTAAQRYSRLYLESNPRLEAVTEADWALYGVFLVKRNITFGLSFLALAERRRLTPTL
jgi:hypothetical protein